MEGNCCPGLGQSWGLAWPGRSFDKELKSPGFLGPAGGEGPPSTSVPAPLLGLRAP